MEIIMTKPLYVFAQSSGRQIRQYSLEEKINQDFPPPSLSDLILTVHEYRGASEVGRHFGLSRRQISKWCRNYKLKGGCREILKGTYDHLIE